MLIFSPQFLDKKSQILSNKKISLEKKRIYIIYILDNPAFTLSPPPLIGLATRGGAFCLRLP